MNIQKNIGYIAGTFTSFAFLPQVYKVFESKSAKGLSMSTLILFFIGQLLWLNHGMYEKDFSVVIFAFLTGILYVYLIYAKLVYN